MDRGLVRFGLRFYGLNLDTLGKDAFKQIYFRETTTSSDLYGY